MIFPKYSLLLRKKMKHEQILSGILKALFFGDGVFQTYNDEIIINKRSATFIADLLFKKHIFKTGLKCI
jgi:hypothetical protein